MNYFKEDNLALYRNAVYSYAEEEASKRIWQLTNVMVGTVVAFVGETIPQTWLLCDGSAISRTTYKDLFKVIGTTYGAGDGSTTFNLPNLIDQFIQGSAMSGIVKEAGLPNIVGHFRPWAEGSVTTSGAFYYITSTQDGWGTATGIDTDNALIDFDASRCSPVYGNSTTVQPPAVTVKYIINYKATITVEG